MICKIEVPFATGSTVSIKSHFDKMITTDEKDHIDILAEYSTEKF